MPRNILLIEDDPQQVKTFQAELRARYRGATVSPLETESDLYKYVESIESGDTAPPDFVVADVMMPWEEPNPNPTPRPAEVKAGGYRRAGVRCLQYFRNRVHAPVPWVLFTILDPKVIQEEIKGIEHAAVASKERPLEELFQDADYLLGVWPETDKDETDYLVNIPAVRDSIIAGLSTPLSDCESQLDP